jgi:plastocyanin
MRRVNVPVIIAVLVCVFDRLAPAASIQATGTIEGRVTFEGTPPPPTIVIQDGGSQQVLYVDRSGGLRYAVVSLAGAHAERIASGAPATMNQRNFIFEPQVLAVTSGQTVRFTSDDPANHNVRAQDPNPKNTFSITTGSGSVGPHTHAFAATPADRPLRLSCDIHPWMAAWIYVFDHPHFAVTKPDGSFRIDGVPAGRHQVAVRQPSGLLARDLPVAVVSGQTARIVVVFAPADVRTSAQ